MVPHPLAVRGLCRDCIVQIHSREHVLRMIMRIPYAGLILHHALLIVHIHKIEPEYIYLPEVWLVGVNGLVSLMTREPGERSTCLSVLLAWRMR